jgi:hypothetical protein
MSEPERAPLAIAEAQPGSTQTASAALPHAAEAHHPHHLVPEKWIAPLLATLGAAFGTLIGTSLYGEIHPKPGAGGNFGEFLLIAAIIGTATYWFFDPLMELAKGWLGAPPSEIPNERRVVTTIVVVGATLLIAILHHSLTDALKDAGVTGFIFILLFFAFTAGATTFYWIRGAQRQPPRSASYGLKIGAAVGAVAGVFNVFLYLAQHKIPAPSLNQVASTYYAGIFARGIGIWTVLFLLPGLLGGLAIEKGWFKSPTRGVFLTLTVLSGGFVLLAIIVGQIAPQSSTVIWLAVVGVISQYIGWGLGPFLQHESCDHVFSGSPAAAATLAGFSPEVQSSIRRSGLVVVPINAHRPSEGTSQGASSASIEGVPGGSVSPQILLLKPTGSRAWAFVLLVLALGVGAWGYVTGAFRSDAEIVAEIQSKFSQDSGLHSKALNAQSAQHVVTVAGMVDDSVQHTAAVQQAAGVRGVKQLIDQLQVGPPSAPKPAAATSPEPAINIHLPVSRSGLAPPPHPVITQKRIVRQPPAASDTKKHGFFSHIFGKKDRNTNKNKNQQ